MPKTINEIFRDFVTDGVPSSGPWDPLKGDIRDWGQNLENKSGKNVSDFGGGVLGIAAMANALGYVRFGFGQTTISSSITISVPLFFDAGAYISASSSVIVNIASRINSEKQWIFRGNGRYFCIINSDGSNGEDGRYLHASWFGVFPQNNDATINQTSAIQKLMEAFSTQTREGVIDFDNGAYRISAPIDVYRGTWIRGAGTRRTTFDLVGNFSAVFRTQDVACRFTGFQFETPNETDAVLFDGVQIQINHLDCTVEDVSFWNPRIGIQVNADRCDIKVIRCINGADVSTLSNSSLIEINASYCRVRDVRVASTSYGPNSIICIGRNQTGPIIGTDISGIETTEDSHCVLINPKGDFSVYQTRIDGVIHQLDAVSGLTSSTIRINNVGNSSIYLMTISGLINNGNGPDLVKISNSGAGTVQDVVISTSVTRTPSGVVLQAGTGVIREITISDSVDLSNCSTPLLMSGATSQIRSPGWLTGFRGDYTVIVNNDTAVSIPTPREGGVVLIVPYGSNGLTPNTAGAGIASYRSVATFSTTKLSGNSNFATVSGDVGGTTGVAGNVTIGVISGNLRLENRLGTPQQFRITWIG